jgi:hypothetical protein
MCKRSAAVPAELLGIGIISVAFWTLYGHFFPFVLSAKEYQGIEEESNAKYVTRSG